MAKKPYYTSSDIIESVKRKIAVPISQNTFTENNILDFANEEMAIAQVPQVLSYHQEYFVSYVTIPLLNNVSRYPIPDRAIAMKLRDVFYMDDSGNLYQMARVDEHDKAYWQQNNAGRPTLQKFYFEGNDVVLIPGVTSAPTGSLVLVFYLRPNQLVKIDRAATISSFKQTITVNNSLINPLDTIELGLTSGPLAPAGIVPLTAISSGGGSITAITNYSGNQIAVTSASHQLTSGQTVIISGSNSVPSINGTYIVDVIDANTFVFNGQIGTAGTSGSFTSPNQFVIGATGTITATNIASSLNALAIIDSASATSNVVTLNYANIYMTIAPSNSIAFQVPTNTIGINFESLPSTYTDTETNETEDLFITGALIDFLQTKPGHRTYVYDVEIPTNSISGTTITLDLDTLQVTTGTVNSESGSEAIMTMTANLQPGDYICLSNECIIPQIPPDFHNGLAERTAKRILAAQGDQNGIQNSTEKIQEINQSQASLMKERSDGNPQKIVNRNSPLAYSGFRRFRRF